MIKSSRASSFLELIPTIRGAVVQCGEGYRLENCSFLRAR